MDVNLYSTNLKNKKKRWAKADFVIGMSIYILLFEEIEIRQGKGRICHSDVNLCSTN